MKESKLSLLATTVICVGSFSLAAAPAWPDIKVEVKAEQPVTTQQTLKQEANGFHRLAITLSNPGQQPLTIEKITVRIPVTERLTDDLEMLYGGSCMGQALLKEVFRYQAMDETVPLDVWWHASQKSDGFELVLARKGKAVYLGVFNWSDTPKEYALASFGKSEPVKLEGRHSVILKYGGKDSFAPLCQKLQSK